MGGSIYIDAAVAAAVATALEKLSTTMASAALPTPSGCDWSQDRALDAQYVLTQSVQQLSNIVGSIAANTQDSAKGFQLIDEAINHRFATTTWYPGNDTMPTYQGNWGR